jgi:hypothetical protein
MRASLSKDEDKAVCCGQGSHTMNSPVFGLDAPIELGLDKRKGSETTQQTYSIKMGRRPSRLGWASITPSTCKKRN